VTFQNYSTSLHTLPRDFSQAHTTPRHNQRACCARRASQPEPGPATNGVLALASHSAALASRSTRGPREPAPHAAVASRSARGPCEPLRTRPSRAAPHAAVASRAPHAAVASRAPHAAVASRSAAVARAAPRTEPHFLPTAVAHPHPHISIQLFGCVAPGAPFAHPVLRVF
jgi:hypothetical protein